MSFNGATAMKPWKRKPRKLGQSPWSRLQWGHGDEAVEEIRPYRQVARGCQASMGPRR